MSQTPEYIANNIVKIVDNKGRFYGTGFFIEIGQDKFCITCHHCIWKLNEIYIERNEMRCTADWIEEFSEMTKDIAILKVYGRMDIKALRYAREAMARFPVSVWGFSEKDLEVFPQGSPVEDGTLSSAAILFNWREEQINGNQVWNKKPQVKVYVFRFSGKFDLGFSGAPVCYTGNNNIVGIFTAKDNNYGYIIPIQTLLEKFEEQQNVSKSLPTLLNMSHYIDKGNNSFDRGNYEDAIKQYEVILNDRNYVIALFNKAQSLFHLNRYYEAIDYYDKVLSIDKTYVMALNNKGWAHYRLGKYNKAIDYYDKVLDIDPNFVTSLNNKGWALFKLGKYNKAIDYYDKVLDIDPKNVRALYNMGKSFVTLREYLRAMEYYDKVFAIDPANTIALSGKGTVYNKLNKYNEAIIWFDKALAIDPNCTEAEDGKKLANDKLTIGKKLR